MDPDLLELATIWRHESLRSTGSSTPLIDLLPQSAAVEGMSCALVIDARYVERITVSTELGFDVAR
jgi:hypothetical protein